MNPVLDQLRAVCAVARWASFSDAARELSLTQPAVTRTIRTVEAGLGCALFARTTRRVELTPEGAEFVGVATDILRGYDEGLERFAAWRRAETGAVVILALPSLAAGPVASIVAQFVQERPGVRVDLRTANADGIMDRVRRGEAQLAVSEQPADGHGFDVHPLDRDPVFAVVAVDHPMALQNEVTWQQLAAYPFIELEETTSIRRLSEAGFAAAGVRPSSTLSGDTIGTVAALIARGRGVSAFPASARALVPLSEVRFVPLRSPELFRSLALLSAHTPTPIPLVRELRSAISASWATTATAKP